MQPENNRRIIADAADSYRILPGCTDVGLVILCDHADNVFPDGYGTLGLPSNQLQRHIAYDIGARAITERLSSRLDAPAVLTRYSRLLIDPNRGPDDPTLVMRLSDGAIIPGNANIDAAERDTRTRLYYRPYHDAIDRVIAACSATGKHPVILSIHSFTESWKGVPRPWHVGVLWDRDPRVALPLLDGFYAGQDILVGDNEPYKGSLRGDCCWQHATVNGLAQAIVEYRQDLVRDAAGQIAWADRTETIVKTLLSAADEHSNLHRRIHYGSHSDPMPSRRPTLKLTRRTDALKETNA